MVTKPVLEKLAKEYADKVTFMPVNADDSREALEQYRVYGIPTVIAFRGGKEVGRVTGAQGEKGYRAMFESLATGSEVRIPLTPLDRALRVGAGTFFMLFGVAGENWLLIAVGGALILMGMHDRIPLFNLLAEKLKRK